MYFSVKSAEFLRFTLHFIAGQNNQVILIFNLKVTFFEISVNHECERSVGHFDKKNDIPSSVKCNVWLPHVGADQHTKIVQMETAKSPQAFVHVDRSFDCSVLTVRL